VIAQDSGNRSIASTLAPFLARAAITPPIAARVVSSLSGHMWPQTSNVVFPELCLMRSSEATWCRKQWKWSSST
jgi:hypothetical protein